MATHTLPASSVSTLTTSALNSLANATYVSAGTIDLSAVDPLQAAVIVSATPGTVSGNAQIVIFARLSMDNSTFTSGPTSGTTTTDEENLYPLGVLPLKSNSTQQVGIFPLASALDFIPPYVQIIIKNETGAALAASGHGVYYSTYTGNSA